MKTEQLKENVIRYHFDPQPGHQFAVTITALINEDKAFLIDTGYEAQVKEVMADLEAKGLTLEGVILTHFHNDHAEGLRALPKLPLYGSSKFQETLTMFTPRADHSRFTPTVKIEQPQDITFGFHRITLIPSPGHSACGMMVKLNDDLLLIGDELMAIPDGTPLLPSADWNDFKRHLASLERLKAYSTIPTIVPSHGPVFEGGQLREEIQKRYAYMNAIETSNGKVSYADASRASGCDFAHNEWHERNCLR